jgi:chromosome transmission fidelity protein 4
MTAVLRGRPARELSMLIRPPLYVLTTDTDIPGATFCSYTPNGKKLITAGVNPALRVFEHGSNDEPIVIDVTTEAHTAVVAANDFVVVGSESGEVTKYSLTTYEMEGILTRCSMPVRELSLSPDGEWLAVASE